MNKPITVGLATGKTRGRIIALILMVLVGRTLDASGQTVTILYSFAGPTNDGTAPLAGLVQGNDGNFYGTTIFGGTHSNGVVFRISPSGNETNLYSFAGPPTDGESPNAGLVQGSDGNFYGTTYLGGTSTNCPDGCGTVFRISPSGSETNLHSFAGPPADGGGPVAGLVLGRDGYFYGTANRGGTNNRGTVFRISPNGTYTTLYSFAGYPNDGAFPYAGLVQGSDGNFYGTTEGGGTSNRGTVFRVSPSGSETNLHSFAGPPTDGGDQITGLVQGSDGYFYGTTSGGGTGNYGTVFRISPSGSNTILHSFTGPPNDGWFPVAGLAQGSDGYFYGTSEEGGTSTNCGRYGCGTVFRVSSSGTSTTLYSFAGSPPDGTFPEAALAQGSDGNFYGTTEEGGTSNDGIVFKLTVPLNPPPYPINQITGVQLADTNVIFNVVSIAYETYQLQFSSSMNPTNWVNVPGVSVTNSIGALLTLTNFGGALQPQGFYRFDITP